MRKKYLVKEAEFEPTLKVNIGTVGLGNTKVFQMLAGGQYKKLRESDAEGPSIENFPLGSGEDLIGTYLKIRTVIDFAAYESEERETYVENIVAKYYFDGGFAGEQSYTCDNDDWFEFYDRRIIIIDFEIDLE